MEIAFYCLRWTDSFPINPETLNFYLKPYTYFWMKALPILVVPLLQNVIDLIQDNDSGFTWILKHFFYPNLLLPLLCCLPHLCRVRESYASLLAQSFNLSGDWFIFDKTPIVLHNTLNLVTKLNHFLGPYKVSYIYWAQRETSFFLNMFDNLYPLRKKKKIVIFRYPFSNLLVILDSWNNIRG